MLPLTAPAPPEVRTRRRHPVRRCRRDLDDVGPGVVRLVLNDLGHHRLARQAVRHEEDPALVAPDPLAAVRHTGELQRHPLAWPARLTWSPMPPAPLRHS